MTRSLPNGVRRMVDFFGSTAFTSFFGAEAESRSARFSAWAGAIVLAFFAVTNALNSYFLMWQTNEVYNLCQRDAKPGEVGALMMSFVWIFAWFLLIEPAAETGKMYYTTYWTKVIQRRYTADWLQMCGDGSEPPVGVSERIVDRTVEFTQLVVDIAALICRAVVVVVIFTPVIYSLGVDMLPALEKIASSAAEALAAHAVVLQRTVASLTSALIGSGPGWLLYTVGGACMFETFISRRIGEPLPVLLDESRKRRADFRSQVEMVQALAADRAARGGMNRAALRAEIHLRLDMWISAYTRTFPRTFALLAWRSGNQQAWQFALIAGLSLCAAAKFIALGTMSSTIHAVNEIRGALLTISHARPVIVRIQSLAMGLRELEQHIARPHEGGSLVAVPAE